jgi:acetolactate synthase-1/3 small subunit
MNKFTLSVLTENSPGVLHRVTVLFTRRKINIESLTVSDTEKHNISRFTIVIQVEKDVIEKVVRQIRRIVEVREVYASENEELLYKEIAFYRVAAKTPERRAEVGEHAQRNRATLFFADAEHVVIEKTGTEDEISSLLLLLEPFGIVEFVRSGRVAIRKIRHQIKAGDEQAPEESADNFQLNYTSW